MRSYQSVQEREEKSIHWRIVQRVQYSRQYSFHPGDVGKEDDTGKGGQKDLQGRVIMGILRVGRNEEGRRKHRSDLLPDGYVTWLGPRTLQRHRGGQGRLGVWKRKR